MVSALPNSELGRNAVSVRGRSRSIGETKSLPALTQCLIHQELGASQSELKRKIPCVMLHMDLLLQCSELCCVSVCLNCKS